MPRPRHDWPGYEPGQAFQGNLEGKPAAIYCRVSSNPDKTETKSTDDQLAEGRDWARRTGVVLTDADIYTDDDFSASRYAVKDRKAFIALRAAVNAGKYKVVWFWATSRQTRGDIPLSELADEYERHGVLWCFSGSLYNPANDDDIMILEIHHVIDKKYSAQLAKDVRRGVKASAYAGRPAARVVYGYKRKYDYEHLNSRGRPTVLGDVPNVFDGNGEPIEDSPAYVVRQIYDRIAESKPVSAIARDLEDRRIPAPQPPRKCRTCHEKTDGGKCPQGHGELEMGRYHWTSHAVLFIARNPFYIGRRIHQAKSWRPADRHQAIIELPQGVEPKWDPLVTEDKWWAVQRILSDPSRLKWKPGKGQGQGTLLSGVARCGECGTPLYVHNDHNRGIVPYYVCPHRSHVGIRVDWLDAYVEDRIVSWAADPGVRADVFGRQEDDSAVARAALGDIDRLETQLEEARARGEDPDEDGVYWARRAKALAAKLAQARELAHPPSLSPGLAKLLGPGADGVADRWWQLRTRNLPAAKQLIKEIASIRVHKGVHGGDRRNAVIDPGRISWAWLTGPGDHQRVFGEAIMRPMTRAADALRADPYEADRVLARKLGITDRPVATVRRQLEDAGEIPVIRRKGRGAPADLGYRPVT